MKKAVVICCLVAIIISLCPMMLPAKVDRAPGGIPAFLVGCCWGIRCGTEWNEGADMHWREWCRIVPYLNIVIMIWDGVDSYSGMTAHDWAAANGANWY